MTRNSNLGNGIGSFAATCSIIYGLHHLSIGVEVRRCILWSTVQRYLALVVGNFDQFTAFCSVVLEAAPCRTTCFSCLVFILLAAIHPLRKTLLVLNFVCKSDQNVEKLYCLSRCYSALFYSFVIQLCRLSVN